MNGSKVGRKFLSQSKQNTCEGCLPACFLGLINKNITLDTELELIVGGFKRYRGSYAPGIIKEFVSKYKKSAKVFVYNKYYFKKLRWLSGQKIKVLQQKIDLTFIKTLETPFILYIDDRILRRSVHWPHFVIVERKYKDKFVLIDPWDGKRKWLTEEKLMDGVLSLKNYLKFCPLAITVE